MSADNDLGSELENLQSLPRCCLQPVGLDVHRSISLDISWLQILAAIRQGGAAFKRVESVVV